MRWTVPRRPDPDHKNEPPAAEVASGAGGGGETCGVLSSVKKCRAPGRAPDDSCESLSDPAKEKPTAVVSALGVTLIPPTEDHYLLPFFLLNWGIVLGDMPVPVVSPAFKGYHLPPRLSMGIFPVVFPSLCRRKPGLLFYGLLRGGGAMSEKKDNVQISLRLDRQAVEKFREICRLERRPINTQMEIILEEWFALRDKSVGGLTAPRLLEKRPGAGRAAEPPQASVEAPGWSARGEAIDPPARGGRRAPRRQVG